MKVKCGIDLVKICRLDEVNPRIRKRFIERVYTQRELAISHESDYLAGLFAAKEAISKALGTGIGKVHWQDIEICHSRYGEPKVKLHRFAKTVAKRKGLRHWVVSITHEGGFAVANAVAVGK